MTTLLDRGHELLQANGVHGPIRPARAAPRGPIGAELSDVTGTRLRVQVWRLSPLGIEVVTEHETAGLLRAGSANLTLRLGEQVIDFPALPIASRHVQDGHAIVAFRWPQQFRALGADDRCGQRWPCDEEFLPTGTYDNSLAYNDTVHLRVTELSRGGMRFRSSLRNKFLVPGQVLQVSIDFAGLGAASVKLRVVRTSVVAHRDRDYLSADVEMVAPSRAALGLISQYLVKFGPGVSVKELRAADLEVTSVLPGIDFGYVQDQDDYVDVLQLRQLAYAAACKVPRQRPASSMGDEFDGRAQVLLARHRGRAVASMRLVLPGPGELLEHETYTPLPGALPGREEVIEITRVCTHPDYRRTDLLQGLFQHAVLSCARAGRRWVIGSSTPNLLPVYTRIGFTVTDLQYEHRALGGDKHVVFVGDLHAVLAGKGVNPLVWNALYSRVWDDADVANSTALDVPAAVRRRLYEWTGPLAARALGRAATVKRRFKVLSCRR